MLAMFKIAGLSAALSVALVSAYGSPQGQASEAAAKIYLDRLPQETRLAGLDAPGNAGATPACGVQAWPHVSADCLTAADGAAPRAKVRTITIEMRPARNTSVLVRVPQTAIAAR